MGVLVEDLFGNESRVLGEREETEFDLGLACVGQTSVGLLMSFMIKGLDDTSFGLLNTDLNHSQPWRDCTFQSFTPWVEMSAPLKAHLLRMGSTFYTGSKRTFSTAMFIVVAHNRCNDCRRLLVQSSPILMPSLDVSDISDWLSDPMPRRQLPRLSTQTQNHRLNTPAFRWRSTVDYTSYS